MPASPYLQNEDQLLAVEWGKSTNWDCRLPDAPAPFNNWFPVTVLERRIASFATEEIAGPVISTSIPAGEESRSLSMAFVDDDKETLLQFFENWYAAMSNDGLAVATVGEAVKTIYLVKLDNTKEIVRTISLYVFPTGEIREVLNSSPQSELKNYVVNFVVAGKVGGARTGPSSSTTNSQTVGTQVVN